jgi:hypothetical protein
MTMSRIKKYLPRPLRRLASECGGAAVVEFALMLPFLITLFAGGFELTRFILLNHKLEKAAYTVSDVVTQQTSVTNAQLEQVMIAATEILKPYELGNNGVIVLSSVYRENLNNPPKVSWQFRGGGKGTFSSKIGTVGQVATLPDNLQLNSKDNIIVAEVFYNFTPMLIGDEVGKADLYKFAIFKPRLGALTTAPN